MYRVQKDSQRGIVELRTHEAKLQHESEKQETLQDQSGIIDPMEKLIEIMETRLKLEQKFLNLTEI